MTKTMGFRFRSVNDPGKTDWNVINHPYRITSVTGGKGCNPPNKVQCLVYACGKSLLQPNVFMFHFGTVTILKWNCSYPENE